MDNIRMLESMFLEATIGIIVVDFEGNIIKSNPFSEKLFGYENGALINLKIEELLPKSFREQHVKYRKSYQQNLVPRAMGANLELYGLRKNGQQFPVKISLSSMEVNGDQFVIAYVSDNSTQQQMLNKLQDSQALLEESQKIARTGSFEIDFQTGQYKWSKEMYRIFGFEDNSEVISKEKYFGHIYSEDVDLVKGFYEKIKEEKKGINFGYRILSKTQGLRYVEGKRDVKLDENNNVVKVFGLLQDVTDLREAISYKEGISKIVEESLNEIFIFDGIDFKFVQVNKGALKNIGYTLEEMQTMTPVDIKPEYSKEDFMRLITPLQEGKVDKLLFESVHQRKDRSTYPVEVHLQYANLGNNPVFVAIILDISERREYERKMHEYSDKLEQKVAERTHELRISEQKLLKALEKERELGELKSRFVSMASHEFRTPLSSILSSASLIELYNKKEQFDKQYRHIDRIKSSVRNLTAILNDFLSLEKLESGKVSLSLKTTNFKSYVEDIKEELKVILKEGQTIDHYHEGDHTISIDPNLVKNILLNLLSNAIKYSPENKPIKIVSHNMDNKFRIEVTDKGMGIPEEDQKHMFSRFFRANNVSNIQGTGLGLTIVKRYLDLMYGKIWFESKLGEGTTFYVEIPKP